MGDDAGRLLKRGGVGYALGGNLSELLKEKLKTPSGWIKADSEKILKFVREQYKENGADRKFVFDCDNTLLRGDVGILGAWGLLRSGLVDPEKVPVEWAERELRDCNFQDFESMRNDLAMATSFTNVFEMETMLLSGFPVDQAYEIVGESVKWGFKMGMIKKLEPISRLVDEFLPQAMIVSGSPKTGVTAVGEAFGVKPDQIFATELNEVDGIIRDEYSNYGVMWAETKREALVDAGHTDLFFVAGDSTGDWNMMGLSTEIVWCMLWPGTKNPWSTLREQIKNHLVDELKETPTEPGFYIGRNDDDNGFAKYWILEVHAEHGPR